MIDPVAGILKVGGRSVFESVLQVTQDTELGVFKVAPLEESKPDKKFAVVFKDESKAKHFLLSLMKHEIPSPIQNRQRYKLMGTHSDGETKIFIFKG